MLQLKTKLLSTCEKYNNVKVPFKHRQVIKRLAESKNIMLLRQDKGSYNGQRKIHREMPRSTEFKSV